jgi:hypothetical protein
MGTAGFAVARCGCRALRLRQHPRGWRGGWWPTDLAEGARRRASAPSRTHTIGRVTSRPRSRRPTTWSVTRRRSGWSPRPAQRMLGPIQADPHRHHAAVLPDVDPSTIRQAAAGSSPEPSAAGTRGRWTATRRPPRVTEPARGRGAPRSGPGRACPLGAGRRVHRLLHQQPQQLHLRSHGQGQQALVADSAISASATDTCSGMVSPGMLAWTSVLWYCLAVAIPSSRCSWRLTRDLPDGRTQAGTATARSPRARTPGQPVTAAILGPDERQSPSHGLLSDVGSGEGWHSGRSWQCRRFCSRTSLASPR